MHDDELSPGRQREPKKKGMKVWQKIFLLVLTLLGIWFTFTNRQTYIDKISLQTYTITGVPILDIQTEFSTIIISTWEKRDKIGLSGFTVSSGWVAPEVKTTMVQQGNVLRVIEHVQPFLSLPGGSGSIDLFLDVPKTTTVIIHTQKGKVDISSVSGRYDIHAGEAEVHIGDGTLLGSSEVETTLGKIDFHGSLDPRGRDYFKTQQGVIALTLPTNAAFDLQAIGYQVPLRNDFGSNHVGHLPRTQIKVEIHGGYVNIYRGT